MTVSPIAAPALLLASVAGLAAAPEQAARATLWGGRAAAVVALLLAVAASVGPMAPLARIFSVLAAAVTAALAFAETDTAVRGARRRVARAAPAACGAASVLAAVLADPAASFGAAMAAAAVGAVLAATAHGPAAARHAVGRLLLVTIAASTGWLGLLVAAAGRVGPGALLLLLGAGAAGPLPPAAMGLARGAARLSPQGAGVVLLLGPLGCAVPMLQALETLPQLTGAGALARLLLLLAAIASVGAGVLALVRPGAASVRRSETIVAAWGLVLFGWGLGSAPGVLAGLSALLFVLLAGLALLGAGRGVVAGAALLAIVSLPPFGGFAALLLLAEAALPVRPVLGTIFLLLVGGFALAVLRRPAEGREAGGCVLPLAALGLSVLLGIAMPASVADALVDAAGLVAGGGG